MENPNLSFIFSLISTMVTGLFALFVLWRWWQKRRPHLLAWGIGLLMYFAGTFSQVLLHFTWSSFFFGLWYWSGALMVAPWLGQGTIYLLWRKGNIARNFQMALLLVGVMTLPWTLFFTPLNAAAWEPGADMTQIYRDQVVDGVVVREGIMPGGASGTVRAFSPVMNIWGTVAPVGGAIYSSWIFGKKQIMRNRVVGNWLIALGGLMPALAGALIRLGDPSFKYMGEMLGAVLIFAGFLVVTRVPDDIPQMTPQAAPSPAESAGD